jgi:CysZ protein
MNGAAGQPVRNWVPMGYSLTFLLRHPRLQFWSLLLVIATAIATYAGYELAINAIDHLTGSFFQQAPLGEGVLHWAKVAGWHLLSWLFLIVSRVVAFYLAFILAFSLTAPGYVILAGATDELYSGSTSGNGESTLSLSTLLRDLWEGIKIGLIGILVTVAALVANFIPVIGQVVVFVIYAFYCALMFIDYPSSRLGWSLGQKLAWVRDHRGQAFRLGLLPAAISLVPLVNVFIMAFCFPLFTVHSTLNFLQIERLRQRAI